MTKFSFLCAGLLAVLPVFHSFALAAAEETPTSRPCPAEVSIQARCYSGQDSAGAFYWIAVPVNWNQVLVMHAHGGPADTGPAKLERSEEDLKRWAITVNAGYAWAGSTYRRGGYGVSMAAEDTERLRQLFVRHFGPARRTLLHGQSYGGAVAAKAAELYATDGARPGPYDGVLLTSGVLGGGVLAYRFRYDLRQVYQQVCNNHPKPDEVQYPFWTGLPLDSKLTRSELAARVDECTGVRKPVADRSATQKANLATIVTAARIDERSLMGHLNWATWLFQDLVQLRLGGRNPFGIEADPQAVAELNHDSAPTGKVTVPVLTLHAIDDPTAFVELESLYREVFRRAGTSDWLVQTFSAEAEHSYLSDPQYPALFGALMDWIDKGDKPTAQTVAQRCQALEVTYGKACKFRPDYLPLPLEQRPAVRSH